MMNWDIERFFTLFITTVFFVGCHFFDDPEESFDESDDECPMNSGYPCACEPKYVNQFGSKSFCDDQSYCIAGAKNPDLGFCSNPCSGLDDTDSCVPWDTSWGIGVGICGVSVLLLEGAGNGCMLLCNVVLDDFTGDKQALSGKCPWGFTCQKIDDAILGFPAKVCTVPDFLDD